jgi:hypothetical protein
MKPVLSAAQLDELVHRYYPVGLHGSEPGYAESEQYERLVGARERAERNPSAWERCFKKLEAALPDCDVEDWSVLLSDNCWRARVYLPGTVPVRLPETGEEGQEYRAVVLLVSILAPVYCLYSSFQVRVGALWRPSRTFYAEVPETTRHVDIIDALVRTEMVIQRLPNETLFTPVSDIQCHNVALGEAKLIDCLFTDDRW